MDFYESNIQRDNICFLIKLDIEDKTKASSQIRVQHNRDVITDDFHPPPNITDPIEESRGHSDYNLTLSIPPNEFVVKVETKIYYAEKEQKPR